MSLYAEYLKEREEIETIEDEKGFLTYKIKDGNFWIYDCFVSENERRKANARRYYNEAFNIALNSDCNELYTTVFVSTNGWEISLKSLIKEGFKIIKTQNDKILLKIEVSKEV